MSAEKGILDHNEEFLLVYDVKNANPNGDPDNDNAVRMDEYTNTVYKTPVATKRDVRDYIAFVEGVRDDGEIPWDPNVQDVFTRERVKPDGSLFSRKDMYTGIMESILKLKNGKGKKEIADTDLVNFVLGKYIDVRMFGEIITAKKDMGNTLKFTGPIVVSFARSMHPVSARDIAITSCFASDSNKTQGSIGRIYVVDYAVMSLNGRISRALAEITRLTQQDVETFYKALWYGTLSRMSHSKNQVPRLLIRIVYSSGTNTHIGMIDDLLSITFSQESGEMVRSVNDWKSIDLTKLTSSIKALQKEGLIDRVEYKTHPVLSDTFKVGETLKEEVNAQEVTSF